MTAARAADRTLDAGVAAFASWTVVYHVCVVAGLGAGWALGGWAVLLAAGAVVWWRLPAEREPGRVPPAAGPARRWRTLALLALTAVLAVAAGAALALKAPYRVVWVLWLAAAACALGCAWLRTRAPAGTETPPPERRPWLELAVVAIWTVGLAVLSLFLNNPDPDDAFYVHQSVWIGAHGEFPLRDVVFADEKFRALYFPPVFSYEALTGALSWLVGAHAADVVYYVVPPLATALAVLALWRLLRAWRVPLMALALTAALAFLLFGAGRHMSFGAFFASRMWQGKVLLLTIVLPVLLARLHQQARRPTRRGLLALALIGAAGVGISSSGIFVMPVVAAGALLPVAVREPGRAAAALIAACAYPVGAGLVTKLSGGRTPDVYTAAQTAPGYLVHFTLGTGALALLALTAALLAPALLPRARAGAMVAGVALLLGLLLSPGVPRAIFDFSGLGRVLWRLTWALPVAASVGAVAVCVAGRRGPALLRALPAVALCAALAAFGTPLWSHAAGTAVASRPVFKREPNQLADARAILARAHPGDRILAGALLSQTLLILSPDVTTVSPRSFFTRALHGQPGAHVAARFRLQRLVNHGLRSKPPSARELRRIRRDLRVVGVDVACVRPLRLPVQKALMRLGFRPWVTTHHVACFRRA